MSPIEAGSSEEDDERGRSRQIAHLAEALKNSNTMLVTKRQHSPNKKSQNGVSIASGKSTGLVVQTTSPGLSAEARKIAHSRSSSELLNVPANQLPTFEQSSGEASDDDALEMRRVPLLRKKSGELVKPALRGSSQKRPLSAPGTPTFPKAVHFNENIEQVRHFLQIDKPSAVSADSSPVETYESESDYPFVVEMNRKSRTVEWEIKTNFPKDSHERQCMPVRVEQINISKDGKTLNGLIAVANIAFGKFVYARFTFDYWKTTSEIAAEYSNIRYAQSSDGYDRFTFSIKLSDQANLQNKTLYLCARYNVAGQEHWDNNSGNNYQVDFTRKVPKQWTKPVAASPQVIPPGIPRSRNTNKGSIPRPRSFPMGSSDDEFSTSVESPFRLRGKNASDRSKSHTFHDSAQHHSASRLSNRYDFNASLHAALATAQDALGEQSGLKPKEVIRPATAPASSASVAPPRQATQSASGTSRPTLGSAEYQALIQRFCYFGSPIDNSTAETSPQPEREDAEVLAETQTDGAGNLSSDSDAHSADSSTSNSPPSPKVQLHEPESKLESNSESKSDPKPEITLEQKANRTPSPSLRNRSPRLHPFRTPSPALNSASAFQEFPHQGLSVQSAQC